MSAHGPAAIRFWRHVGRAPSGCWIWNGAVAGGTGYGIFNRGGGVCVGAHCFAWELANPGASRAGLVVRHTCDTPLCVNPRHLVLGTHAQNTADMDARGRRVRGAPRGEAHPAAKLTAEIVREARAAHRSGSASTAALARKYGVTPVSMARAIAGRTWTDVE